MTDEQIWLLQFGRGWVPWYELSLYDSEEFNERAMRMHKAGQLQGDASRMMVRLKPQEEDATIRV